MNPDLRARFEPIVAAMNDLLGADFLGRPMVLEDFAHVWQAGHPLNDTVALVWSRALHHALTNPDACVGIAETWEMFGDLIVVRVDPVSGPVYVAKRTATERELAKALELLVRGGESVH